MSNVRNIKITAKYPMFGDADPTNFIESHFDKAKANGAVDEYDIIDISEGAYGIQNITFWYKTSLDVSQEISQTFEDAKALTDIIVNDTDTEILNVELL